MQKLTENNCENDCMQSINFSFACNTVSAIIIGAFIASNAFIKKNGNGNGEKS